MLQAAGGELTSPLIAMYYPLHAAVMKAGPSRAQGGRWVAYTTTFPTQRMAATPGGGCTDGMQIRNTGRPFFNTGRFCVCLNKVLCWPHIWDGTYRRTMQGELRALQEAADAGGDLSTADFHGLTPLHVACTVGRPDILKVRRGGGAPAGTAHGTARCRNLQSVARVQFAAAQCRVRDVWWQLMSASACAHARTRRVVLTIRGCCKASLHMGSQQPAMHGCRCGLHSVILPAVRPG